MQPFFQASTAPAAGHCGRIAIEFSQFGTGNTSKGSRTAELADSPRLIREPQSNGLAEGPGLLLTYYADTRNHPRRWQFPPSVKSAADSGQQARALPARGRGSAG